MGGNALKQAGLDPVRLDAATYRNVVRLVTHRLDAALGDVRTAVVPSYTDKTDFGDLDVVVASDALPPDWQDRVVEAMGSRVRLSNGPVFTVEFDGFQVDLLTQPAHRFDFALRYFAFNDLGNLIGQISRRLGFKFGQQGLVFVNRRGPDGCQVVGEIPVTTDFDAALRFLGYDPDRHRAGFADLASIFAFAASSAYFDASVFPLAARSHKARIRDRKRPTYNAFLRWLDHNRPADGRQEKPSWHLARAMEAFPDFRDRLVDNDRAIDREATFREVFNGHSVGAVTGLSGRALGEYMARVKTVAGGYDALVDRVLTLQGRRIEPLLNELEVPVHEI